MPEPLIPDDFLFGVATAGFQIEGGFNGPDEPANNWAAWEQAGRIEPSGAATSFFDDPESQLDRAHSIGLNSFRLSIEWARIEPERGSIDRQAIDRYRAILSEIKARSMEPVVTLQHFTHPSWLGVEPWRDLSNASILSEWMERAVGEFGDLVDKWVTINEPNILCVETFFTGSFPPGKRLDVTAMIESYDTLLTAHIAGYGAIKRLQPDSIVTTNPYTLSIYELDQMATDLLMSREVGIEPSTLTRHLEERRAVHYDLIGDGGPGAFGTLERSLRSISHRLMPLRTALPATRTALAASDHDAHLDVIAIDHYVPPAALHFGLPGRQTSGGRHWDVGRALWDDEPEPRGMVTVLTEAGGYGRPVWILENGMCNRVRNGRSYARMDALRRPQYLADHLGAMTDAIADGVDVRGFWHWTLIDNYEWGSFEPRFGLYGMDRARGLRVEDTDALGDDAAGAYRTMIEGLRRGDRSVVSPPLPR